MRETVILNHLLDKYENSKHLLHPGESNKRVMLRVEKKEFPEYQYEEVEIRDVYNRAAKALEEEGLVTLEWVKGRPVLARVVLCLDRVMDCYRRTKRMHPKEQAEQVVALMAEKLERVTVPWISAWRDEITRNAQEKWYIPAAYKKENQLLQHLLTAMEVYDALHGEPITMRALSSKCYHDTKYFEKHIRDHFLTIAAKYDEDLAVLCEEDEMGSREQLAYLGIYARPELYELSGHCTIRMEHGILDVGAAYPYGIALSSTAVDAVEEVQIGEIQQIVFIENKTNYDEFLLSELQPGILAVYQGGFLSPQRRKFFSKLSRCIPENVRVLFWADIDLGGFRMFAQLQRIFSQLQPMRMSAAEVWKYQKHALPRSEAYLLRLQESVEEPEMRCFKESADAILQIHATIEQEVFLLNNTLSDD